MISRNELLERIVSIGFELESPDFTPINIAYEQGDGGGVQIYLRFKHDDALVDHDFLRSTDTTLQDQRVIFDTLTHAGMNGELTGLMQPNDHEHPNIVPVFINPGPFYRARAQYEEHGEMQQVINHTEFKVTYREIEQSNNVLLLYLLQTLQRVRDYIMDDSVIVNRVDIYPDGGDAAVYQDPDWGLDQPYDTYFLRYDEPHLDDFMYVVPSGGDHDPLGTIPWEPQCTIGIHITDLFDVLNYLTQGVESNVSECWAQAYQRTLEELHVRHEDLSPLERNLIFLFCMYVCKDMLGLTKGIVGDGRDFRVGVRHTFGEVYRYHRERAQIAGGVMAYLEDNDPTFDPVTRIPYDGVILLELRDFFLQFLQLTGCAPITPEVLAKGIPLNTMIEATTAHLVALEEADAGAIAEGIAQLALDVHVDPADPADPVDPVIAGLDNMALE